MSRGWAGEALERLTPEEAAAEESDPKALVLVVRVGVRVGWPRSALTLGLG